MKKQILLLLVLGMFTACCYADHLGDIHWSTSHLSFPYAEAVPVVNFQWKEVPYSSGSVIMFFDPVTPGMAGQTLTVDSSTSGFSYFADLFTNGTDDYSEIYGEIYDVSMGAGTLCLESMHLYPKTNPNAKVYGEKFVDNGYVDFLGYEITQIDLHFDDLDLYVQDGWTYTYWDVTIGIYGEPVPEPCSLSFLLLGTLAFYRRSKILSSK
jgi:hypothetical protein